MVGMRGSTPDGHKTTAVHEYRVQLPPLPPHPTPLHTPSFLNNNNNNNNNNNTTTLALVPFYLWCFAGFGAPKVALRFTSGVGGVPELASAEAYVEFEKNVRADHYDELVSILL